MQKMFATVKEAHLADICNWATNSIHDTMAEVLNHLQDNYGQLMTHEIKAKDKSIYSSLGGGAHGHLGLVLTNAQYALISSTPFVYPTHPGPLIILDGKTTHAYSNR